MALTPDVLNRGFLIKEGGKGHSHTNSKKRFFCLRDLFVFYYEDQPSPLTKNKPKGLLYIPNLSVKDSNKPGSFIIASKDKEYYIYISDKVSEQERNELLAQWRDCFQYVILKAGAIQTKLQTHSGTLTYKSQVDSATKYHFFLRGNLLNYYSHSPSKENDISNLKGWIDLLCITSIKSEGDNIGGTEFVLVARDGKRHTLIAKDIDEKNKWVSVLNQQIKVLSEAKFPVTWSLKTEKLKYVGKFSLFHRGKSHSYTVALTSASIRLYKDGVTEEALKSSLINSDYIGTIPLTLAYATRDDKVVHVTDYEGSIYSFTCVDGDHAQQWLDMILKSAHSATSALVKNGGTIKTFAHIVGDEEFAIVSMTGQGIVIERLASKSQISMGTEDFKQATVVDTHPNVCILEYGSSSVYLRLSNARALALATKAAIEGLRKKKSGKRKKTTGKKRRAKKKINDKERARLRALFDKFDTDKSNSIDKNEMRAVIEAAFKTKVTEALIQKYVEVEFEKHDTDKSGTIDFDEFCKLYSSLYLDPELPIVLTADELVAPSERKLETGENAPKIEKQEIILTPEQKRQALEAFEKYDADGSETIDRSELKKLLMETLGAKMSEKIIDRYVEAQFQLGDTDGSGTIDKAEFIELYAKLFFAGNGDKSSTLAPTPMM